MNTEEINNNEINELTPPELRKCAKDMTSKLLPTKSEKIYESTYQLFDKWRQNHNTTKSSENILLSYFDELIKKYKPSSMWSIYSMLKTTINLKEGIDISKYHKLISLLKRHGTGFRSKKSSVLMPEEIKTFLQEAPDDQYLGTKVRLVYIF